MFFEMYVRFWGESGASREMLALKYAISPIPNEVCQELSITFSYLRPESQFSHIFFFNQVGPTGRSLLNLTGFGTNPR